MLEETLLAYTAGMLPDHAEPPESAGAPSIGGGALVDGRYRALREIGSGGGGVVFEAEHVHTGARVALKTLCRMTSDAGRRGQRLLREARILGSIRHPGVVRVLDAGECRFHGPFMAMPLIRGRTLQSFIAARGQLDVPSVVALVGQAAGALMALDARGVVHGDVKPSNMLVSPGACEEPDRAVLIDFGVAMQVGGARGPMDRLTYDGDVVGTPEYMAPEQVLSRAHTDHRADVYGLGALAYECLTGVTPFSGTPLVVMSALTSGARPAPIESFRSDVPPAVAAAVMRALDPVAAQRWPNAASFARGCSGGGGGRGLYLYAREDAPSDRLYSPQSRRRSIRAPYVAPGRLLFPSGAAFDCRVEDISPRGLLVIAPAEARPESALSVRFPLPMSGRVVTLAAIVRWVRPRAAGHAQGLELCDVPPEVHREIEAYLAPFGGGVST